MALRKVALMGHPVLRKPADPVPENKIGTAELNALIKDMVETMVEYDGRGLAAPQIHESLQLVVMIWDFDPEKDATLLTLINPVIKPLTQETSAHWEGCLSVPGLRGKVSRPNKISVKAVAPDGQKLDFVAEGFAATVIQHECDHLHGTLYVDRIEDPKDFAFTREYQRFIAPHEEGEEEEGEAED